ncbi:MAG: monovalent cation/H(+) antiporter subunit G [Ardenticatenaceae bacterium]|nr:monovalent cation/H(+) antiporter subunit G [Ardenticatenaceae bacterium]
MAVFLNVLSFFFLVFGAVFIFVGGIGMLRMPDLFLRMSATTKTATLGVAGMLLGTAIFFGELGVVSRAFAIFIFILATAPVSAHMIGRAAYSNGVPLYEKTVIDELREHIDEAKLNNPVED